MKRAFLIFVLACAVPTGALAQDKPVASESPATIPDTVAKVTRADPVLDLDEILNRLARADDADTANLLAEEAQARFRHSGSASVDLILTRGMQAQARGDLDLASDFYADLTDLAPKFAEGWNMRANVEYQRGDLQGALDDMAKAIDLQPRNFAALASLGQLLESMQQYRAALKAYDDALRVHPFLETAIKGKERLEKAVNGRQL